MDGDAHGRDRVPALPPWSGAQHLEALRRHIVLGRAPELDVEGYATELLALSDVPLPRWDAWVPGALRWALRPELGSPRDDGRWVDLPGGARVRLGHCAWSERVAAAREAILADGGDATDPIRLAEQVLVQALWLSEQPRGATPAEVGASAMVQLADALLHRHDRASNDDALPSDDDERVRQVLTLHRALGRMIDPSRASVSPEPGPSSSLTGSPRDSLMPSLLQLVAFR